MDEVSVMISTLGFPIFACCGLSYFLYTLINRLLGQLDKFGISLDNFNDTLLILGSRVERIEKVLEKEINRNEQKEIDV